MAARSPLASAANIDNPASFGRVNSGIGSNMNNSYRSSGFFPQQRDDGTVSNAVANASASVQPNHFDRAPVDGARLELPLTNSNHGKFTEEWDASQRGSSIVDAPTPGRMRRSNSVASAATAATGDDLLSRGNTLKKKPSLRRGGSLKRSGSRRSMKAGSVRSLALQSTSDPDEAHSVFYCPVPTSGSPTDVLANRFQAWRKILKDLIAYFREIQAHYEHRSKSLLKLANVANNITTPPGFLASGGLDDALQIIRTHNRTAIVEANKAREIEEDVILALTGLRSDLQQKIKEIKNLSGDFKNSVTKEMDSTRKAVKALQDVLGQSELDSSLSTGKQDPYLLRLAVDRQVERQIDEENYLHQAYLNLESSGRELESIVVGEIQKAYNAYVTILKREADEATGTMEELRLGPISMPKDHEWSFFAKKDNQFVDPEVPIRSAEHIHYPGRDHVACQEIRAGLLERKSKYLKSYAAGWYVLSPTHLHEFKSADKAQAPVMSLYLPEQKLGSHSAGGGSSNKFILKGRQTGAMHRGHTWVFRAESHDTMMAWYEDIKALTEKTPQERSDFVRTHSRSFSQASNRSMSSDGVVDEDDDEPFAGESALANLRQTSSTQRPQPGGRFPSDIQVNAQRGLQVPLSPSSISSTGFPEHQGGDNDAIPPPAILPGSGFRENVGTTARDSKVGYEGTPQTTLARSHVAATNNAGMEDGVTNYTSESVQRPKSASYGNMLVPEGSIKRSSRPHSGNSPGTVMADGAMKQPPSHHQGASEGAETARLLQPDDMLNGSVKGPDSEFVASRGRSPGDGSVVSAEIPRKAGLPGYPQTEPPAAVVGTGEYVPPPPTSIYGVARAGSVPHIPGEFPKSAT